jgi:hypothetical protein
MMRTLLLTTLFFTCLACESKPTREESPPAPPSSKATPEGTPSIPQAIDLQVKVEAGPPGLESTVTTNAPVLNCLRQGIDPMDQGFYVGMAGKISAAGSLIMPLVTGGNPALNLCLAGALKDLKFAKAHPGPFRLVIRRATQGKGKGFRLDLGAVKKFE